MPWLLPGLASRRTGDWRLRPVTFQYHVRQPKTRDSRLATASRLATDRNRDRQPARVELLVHGPAGRHPPAGGPAAGAHLPGHRGPLGRRAAAGALRHADPDPVPGYGGLPAVRGDGGDLARRLAGPVLVRPLRPPLPPQSPLPAQARVGL